MAKNSLYRNTAFDLTKAIFQKPQTRLEANRWLLNATFGPGTPETDIAASTKLSIVPLSGTQDDAAQLMSVGYVSYLNTQFADNTTPDVFANGAKLNGTARSEPGLPYGPLFNEEGRYGSDYYTNTGTGLNAWFFAQAVHGTAQVRLKLAYALSQIFVVNGTGNASMDYQSFYSLLFKATQSNNTSTFRTLLEDVTYSRAMATMLTYNGNVKENIAINSHPDENYAREILQLFTLGLTALNIDGTDKLDSNGVPIPTYLPADIPQIARIFTGLRSNSDIYDTKQTLMQVLYTDDHETGSKVLFAYPGASAYTIPASTGSTTLVDNPPNTLGYVISNVTINTFDVVVPKVLDSLQRTFNVQWFLSNNVLGTAYVGSCAAPANSTTLTVTLSGHGLTNGTVLYFYSSIQKDIKIFLDYVFNHPNVGPFIARSLIKFFVTSNPTPNYIARVATKFNDNGSGVRGDLSAVVKSILLDQEAIIPYGINQNNHGRYTTLVDRYIRVARAMRNDMVHVVTANTTDSARNSPINSVPPITQTPYFTRPRSTEDYHACAVIYTGSILPMQSSSVFNFYRPGYTPGGTLLGSLGKTAPETQINTVLSQLIWSNAISSMCETEWGRPKNEPFVFGDPKGNASGQFGYDLQPPVAGYTVTAVDFANNNITINGTVGSPISAVGAGYNYDDNISYVGTNMYNRVKNIRYSNAAVAGQIGSGVQNITVYCYGALRDATPPVVGDVIDFAPHSNLGTAGFPGVSYNSSGGQVNRTWHPFIFMFYKVAALIPNTSAIPTSADLTLAINYLESVLMTRPITAAGRSLMVSAGQVPVTILPPVFTYVNASDTNHYMNQYLDYAQKRARRMTGILLALPEFSTQR